MFSMTTASRREILARFTAGTRNAVSNIDAMKNDRRRRILRWMSTKQLRVILNRVSHKTPSRTESHNQTSFGLLIASHCVEWLELSVRGSTRTSKVVPRRAEKRRIQLLQGRIDMAGDASLQRDATLTLSANEWSLALFYIWAALSDDGRVRSRVFGHAGRRDLVSDVNESNVKSHRTAQHRTKPDRSGRVQAGVPSRLELPALTGFIAFSYGLLPWLILFAYSLGSIEKDRTVSPSSFQMASSFLGRTADNGYFYATIIVPTLNLVVLSAIARFGQRHIDGHLAPVVAKSPLKMNLMAQLLSGSMADRVWSNGPRRHAASAKTGLVAASFPRRYWIFARRFRPAAPSFLTGLFATG